MIRIRYSKKSGVDVEGTREELQGIRARILALTHSGTGSCVLDGIRTESPAPYESWLDRLVLGLGPGPARVVVSGDSELWITGDRESLGALASFFDAPDDAESGWHSHYEHYAGNRWVAEDSEPLCISLRRPATA